MSQYYIRDIQYTEEEISRLTISGMVMSHLRSMPKSLFKYFPNLYSEEKGKCGLSLEKRKPINYSQTALLNNTVYLQTPTKFDDPYDCNIFIDANIFALERIRYYSSQCGIVLEPEWDYSQISYHLALKIYNHIMNKQPLEELFIRTNSEEELVSQHKKIFISNIELELFSPYLNSNSINIAINKTIEGDYADAARCASRFRVSCFTQSPYSMLMWSHYANNHKGFCIEYEIPPYSVEKESLFCNLFPVIYTDQRIDLSKFHLNWDRTGRPSTEDLNDYYKYGLLCKSLDWRYQQEWRLISCDNLLSTDDNYNCRFFDIKKVYLGNKMSSEDRLEIIDICKQKGIPYSGITIEANRFEMHECSILCEDCPNLSSVKQNRNQR